MRVLVTGSDGYIGSVLGPYLVEQGHDVVGLDAGFYRAGWLYNPGTPVITTLTHDIRDVTGVDLEGFDAVVHMAELSNDPLGQLAPTITYEINHHGSVELATAGRRQASKRFVYTSSCSVYGRADEELVDEESPLDPQTAYAICKQLCRARRRGAGRRRLLADVPAQRDRVRRVTSNAFRHRAEQPLRTRLDDARDPHGVRRHALAAARACARHLPGDRARARRAARTSSTTTILNVGDREGNYQIRDIAEIVGRVFPDCEVTVGGRGPDERSYRVSFAKIHELLPELACEWTVELGARQLRDVFAAADLTPEDFLSRSFTRLKQIEHLLRTGQIDKSFRSVPVGLMAENAADHV